MHPAIYLPICKYNKSRMFEKCFINNTTKTVNTKQYNNSNNSDNNNTTCKDFIKQYEKCITGNIKNINDDTKKLENANDTNSYAFLFVV